MADRYGYYPCYSTTAFFHIANGRNPEFLNLRADHPLPDLDLSFIPQPFTILSSSSGFILIRGGPSNSYYLFDPLYPPVVGLRRLPDPPIPHPINTPAVVVVTPIVDYEIVCIIADGQGGYTVNKFNSRHGFWVAVGGAIDLEGRRILPNTGVSWGRYAFWLTEATQVIVSHDLDTSDTTIIEVPGSVGCGGKLQLGSSGLYLGLVAVDNVVVRLFQYVITNDEKYWNGPVFTLDVDRAGADVHSTNGHLSDRIVCRGIPQPLRFESKKVEVLFLVDGRRLALWETSDQCTQTRVVTLIQELQEEDVSAVSVANGVPYTISYTPPPAGVWPSIEPVGFSLHWN